MGVRVIINIILYLCIEYALRGRIKATKRGPQNDNKLNNI